MSGPDRTRQPAGGARKPSGPVAPGRGARPARPTNDPAAHLLQLQRTAGNQAVGRLLGELSRSRATAAGRAALVQRAQHKPGDRIPFQLGQVNLSGLIAKIRKDSQTESQVEYEVDAAKDGVQKSYVVTNGQAQVDMPAQPQMPAQIDTILHMGVRRVTQEMINQARESGHPLPGSVAEGDIMVGDAIVIKKPKIVDKESENIKADSDVVKAHKRDFAEGALRDLWIMAQTESGKALLTSLDTAGQQPPQTSSAPTTGQPGPGAQKLRTFIGYQKASNAGGGDEGFWNAAGNRPSKGSAASVGYNPSTAGLPIEEAAHVSDPEIAPALQADWGRPKEKPSDVTLFHELVHADDILHGRLYTQEVTSGQFPKSQVAEMHAVGLEEYRDTAFIEGRAAKPEIYSENTYRHERGVAQRPWYKDTSETQPRTTPALTGDEPRAAEQQRVAVPAPMGGFKKAFSSKKTITAHDTAIQSAKSQNAQIDIANAAAKSLNEQIDIANSRKALLQATKASNKQAADTADLMATLAEPEEQDVDLNLRGAEGGQAPEQQPLASTVGPSGGEKPREVQVLTL